MSDTEKSLSQAKEKITAESIRFLLNLFGAKSKFKEKFCILHSHTIGIPDEFKRLLFSFIFERSLKISQ
jgi:hypothetical protein